MELKAGMKVHSTAFVDRHAYCFVDRGSFGVIESIDDESIWVKFIGHEAHDLEEWGGCVQFSADYLDSKVRGISTKEACFYAHCEIVSADDLSVLIEALHSRRRRAMRRVSYARRHVEELLAEHETSFARVEIEIVNCRRAMRGEWDRV